MASGRCTPSAPHASATSMCPLISSCVRGLLLPSPSRACCAAPMCTSSRQCLAWCSRSYICKNGVRVLSVLASAQFSCRKSPNPTHRGREVLVP